MNSLTTLISFLGLSFQTLTQKDALYLILLTCNVSGSRWAKLEATTKKDRTSKVHSAVVSSLPEHQKISWLASRPLNKVNCNTIKSLGNLKKQHKEF